MVKSMRVRLQIWYAAVLLLVIVAFAGSLYMLARGERLRSIDARLESAANYLVATVRGLPPEPLDRPGPPGLPFPGPRGRPRPDGPRGDGPAPQGADFDGRFAPGPHRPEREEMPRAERRPPGRGPREFDRFGPDAEERLRVAMELPHSLLDGPESDHEETIYFKIWRGDGSLLAESRPARVDDVRTPARRPGPSAAGFPPGFRWQPGDRREIVMAGPRGLSVLVGKPVGRELAELRGFAWRLGASGALVLLVGLAGGWLISRSITAPIDAIAGTASEISAHNLARRIDTASLDRELVGLAQILNQMFERLEGAFERQSRFTSDASHELRTPLAVLHAHAELALSKPRSAEEYRETLAACLAAAGRMATLVDGLLTLARADAGRLEANFRNLDWREVVEEVVDQFRQQAAAAEIELSSSLVDPVPVRGDIALLARVSSNLLSNALRYTARGGRVHVELLARGSDGAVLAVEDTGCGIALEDQSRVFERFFRADKARSRTQGGNGLGLAICKTLVEVHHGRISFSSTPGQGTRFEVRLPLTDAPAPERLIAAPRDPAES